MFTRTRLRLPETINPAKLYQATITTAKGNIVLCLQPELAPKSVNNFVTLCAQQVMTA